MPVSAGDQAAIHIEFPIGSMQRSLRRVVTLIVMHETQPPSAPALNLANLISALRIALTPVVAWATLTGMAGIAVVGFVAVVASDLLDGFVARRRGETSALGTMLDHGADALFVTTLCAVAAMLGLLPSLLAPMITLAFIQYVLDSVADGKPKLRPSQMGRSNGIAYFIVTGAAIAVQFFARGTDPATYLLMASGWILVITTIVSIADRARHTIQASPDS